MKGLTPTWRRAGSNAALVAWLACPHVAATAPEICALALACPSERAAPQRTVTPRDALNEIELRVPQLDALAELSRPSRTAPRDTLEGGGRAALARPHGPAPTGGLAWSTSMDRHELIVGAIDPDHDDGYEYRLPYGDKVSYAVIQGYDARLSHRGAEQYTVDFGMPVGTPVHAARDGVVALAEDSHDVGCWREECGRLANFVVLLHADGTTGEYFHLQRGSVQVRLGQRVGRGDLLAFSGNTGYTTAPHLHFGVYRTKRDGQTQSLAIRFATRSGTILEPRPGARYLNVPTR
jgi:murein DD-endopeptidase MepM/ murein hydrolase activator NlpD